MSRASIGEYVVTSKLGSGSFAVVYKGYHKVTKVPVAIKALSLNKLNSKLLANLEMEIAIMRQIDHPNIVKLYEIKKTEKHMYLMLEYCAGGDLQQYMRRQQQKANTLTAATTNSGMLGGGNAAITGRLSEEVAQHFLKELAKGMKCLWTHNLIHRDLKPQNLLLAEDSPTSVLKIADFGFARHLANTSMAETLCGSPLYMAPEILKFQKYDAKADLWSVGTILYEMVVGKPPYGGSNHVQLLANIERNELSFPKDLVLSDACKNLLLGLLHRKPVNRMGFDDFFSDPFVDLFAESSDFAIQEPLQSAFTVVNNQPATASIREEDEEMEEEPVGTLVSLRQAVATASSGQTPVTPSEVSPLALAPRLRAASVSHESSGSSLRNSRSGNMEVMQTVFGSTSTAGVAGLRRSSRLVKNRRSTSSGAILVNENTNSPRLSPQMSPQILPSPSPRINPFKDLSESPPGAAALLHGSASSGSVHLRTSTHSSPGGKRVAKHVNSAPSRLKMGGPIMDSSEEYVLVESGNGKAVGSSTNEESAAQNQQSGSSQAPLSTLLAPSGAAIQFTGSYQQQKSSTLVNLPSFSHEYGQQLVEIILLRTQAIAPIADQLWKLSSASETLQQRESLSASGTNLASMFSSSSSIGSLPETQALIHVSASSTALGSGETATMVGKKHYVFAAEALTLYVKCLRLIQHGVLYLRHDPALSKRLSTSSSSVVSSNSSRCPVPWSEANRKLSMAYLTEQLNFFLERAEQCKKRMAVCLTNSNEALVSELQGVVVSQEELLYTHAIRLGKQGAIKEVLGQTQNAYDHYLQAMLLLESLMMETSSPSITASPSGTKALAVEDQKCVNAFLKALEERLKNVKLALEDNRQQKDIDVNIQYSPLHHKPSMPVNATAP